MASGPITSWQIEGKKVEIVTDFLFLDSKITADGDCSHEIKRCFLLGRKAVTNRDSILKSRDMTLPTKVCLVKAVVFPVVVYRCDLSSRSLILLAICIPSCLKDLFYLLALFVFLFGHFKVELF